MRSRAVLIGAERNVRSAIRKRILRSKTKNNTLIVGPGGYQFSDYWRMGLPL